MISLLNNFNVPGLDYITLFPDNDSPFKFYYFRSTPKLSEDAKTHFPTIDYKIVQYPRNKANDDLDTQFGYLTMTVDLGLTADEEKTIRKSILEKLKDDTYRSAMRVFYPEAFRILPEKDKITDSTIDVNGLGVIRDGNVKFELLEGFGKDIKRDSSSDFKPSSAGNYAASIWASFGKGGSELILRSLESNVKTGDDSATIATSAIIRYDLTPSFHIPAIDATVDVDTHEFRLYVKQLIEDSQTSEGKIDFQDTQSSYYRYRAKNRSRYHSKYQKVRIKGNMLVTDDDISDITAKAFSAQKGITIHISDYTALQGTSENDLSNEIMRSLIQVITGTIIPYLFTPSPAPQYPAPEAGSDSDSKEDQKEREYAAKKIHYSLTEGEVEGKHEHIHFTFSKDAQLLLPLSANSTLMATVPAEYADKIVHRIDLETTEFFEKTVNVSSDLNFNVDQIRSLEVEILYDEPDVRFPNKRPSHFEFAFKTGQEVYSVNFFCSKNKNGDIIEDYKYRTRISYVGRGTINQNEGWSEWFKTKTSSLMVNFENSGFINVNCKMGDIDWSLIKTVTVEFNYPHVQGKTDTSAKLIFREGDGEKVWSCYKYGKESNEYTYLVRYKNLDDSEYAAPLKTATNKDLSIDDLYEGAPLEADFLVSYSDSLVKAIRAEVHYKDDALKIDKKFTQWMDNREWHWRMNLRAGAVQTFRYRYHVEYADGTFMDTDWSAPCGRNADIPVFSVTEPTSNTAKISVNGMALRNWEDWDFAEVFVSYKDPENKINQDFDVIVLSSDHLTETLEVQCPAGTAKPFLCSACIYTKDGKVYEVEEKEMTRTFTLRKPEE